MNITANTVVSKLFVAFVAASMLVMLATPAKAATATELQAQIDALMAQIAALQGSTAPAATPAAGCTFTRALTVGSQGADVKCLQDYLTPTYFTNAGGSTGYFGSITAAAVAAWQTANGVSPAVGYFGPVSQAKYAAMMAATPDTDDSDDTDDTDGDDDTNSGDLSGEASLTDIVMDSASDDSIEEGEEEAELGVATVEFGDGDAMITRLDVSIDTAITGTDAWDAFEEVSLVVDGDVVATMDASDKDEYLSEADGTLRFSGLDIVAMEDEEVEISIVGTVGNLDTSEEGTYEVSVDAIRFVDADDVTDTITAQAGTDLDTAVSFTIGAAGVDDELIVKTSSEDPDATTLTAENDAKSDWYTVFAFDLDTDDSVNDIELTSVDVTVLTTGSTTAATYNKLVDDAELVIGDVTIDDFTITPTGGDAQSVVLRFDVDGDVTIDAGDRVGAELRLKFNTLNALDEGATVQAKVLSADANAIVAEGADDLDNTSPDQLTGSAIGEVHTLRTVGVSIDGFNGELDVTTANTADDSFGEFTMEFDVTAVGDDEVYIALTSTNTLAVGSTTKGAVFKVTDSSGTAVSSADSLTSTFTLVSGGDDSTAGYIRLDSGDTATVKLTIVFNPATAGGLYGATLDSVGFAASAIAPTGATRVVANPSTSFDIDAKNISS